MEEGVHSEVDSAVVSEASEEVPSEAEEQEGNGNWRFGNGWLSVNLLQSNPVRKQSQDGKHQKAYS